MNTLLQTRDALVKDLKEIMGYELLPGDLMWTGIKAFMTFLNGKGIEHIEEINFQLLEMYRMQLRFSANFREEDNLFSSACALLFAAANQGWIGLGI
jgi:hypothetical protein